MGKRRAKKSDEQLTFVPDGEIQPGELKVQPNVKDGIYEPDTSRFFYLDWKDIRAGHKQWNYWWDQANEILDGIRASVVAFPGEIMTLDDCEEYGLPEAWEEYSSILRLTYKACPRYLEWFAQRVELEHRDLVQKCRDWEDSLLPEEEFTTELWELDRKVCAYEDFVAAVRTVVPKLPVLQEGEPWVNRPADTRLPSQDAKSVMESPVIPPRPDHPCLQCECEDWWLRLQGGMEWLCDRCHPNPGDGIAPSTRKEYHVIPRECPAVFLL